MNYGLFYTADGEVPLVRCRALDDAGFRHCFTTRIGGVSTGCLASLNMSLSRGDEPSAVAENTRRVYAAAGFTGRLCRTKQVHSSEILLAADAESAPSCDGLAAPGGSGAVLCGSVADCVPVLLADPRTGAACFVHAGWRGTAALIAEKGVRFMAERFGCRREDIIAAVGPAIGPCCFLVHDDVASALPKELLPACSVPAPDGRLAVDLPKLNAMVLERAGVTNVCVSGECTCCAASKYYSHRRDGERRGCMAAMIEVQ